MSARNSAASRYLRTPGVVTSDGACSAHVPHWIRTALARRSPSGSPYAAFEKRLQHESELSPGRRDAPQQLLSSLRRDSSSFAQCIQDLRLLLLTMATVARSCGATHSAGLHGSVLRRRRDRCKAHAIGCWYGAAYLQRVMRCPQLLSGHRRGCQVLRCWRTPHSRPQANCLRPRCISRCGKRLCIGSA